jgi:HD-like signal output (HDOD) protein
MTKCVRAIALLTFPNVRKCEIAPRSHWRNEGSGRRVDYQPDMWKWLTSVFVGGTAPAPAAAPEAVRVTTPDAAASAPQATLQSAKSLRQDEALFLAGLVEPPPSKPEEFTKDDQLFLAGILKRWHAHKLEMPVLPKAALRLGAMLRKGNASVAEIVALLDSDPALSVEVLKAANSAAFASSAQTTSVKDAILRMGVERLQGILILAHMRTKVLRGGPFQGKAELLMELAVPLGTLASTVARGHRTAPDLCFVRGMLLHAEHLVILGALADVSRDHRRALLPGPLALIEAFSRHGEDIRRAVATAWQLDDLLLGSDDESDVWAEYAGLRHALIWRWLDRPLPRLAHCDPDTLTAALANVSPRLAGDRAA